MQWEQGPCEYYWQVLPVETSSGYWFLHGCQAICQHREQTTVRNGEPKMTDLSPACFRLSKSPFWVVVMNFRFVSPLYQQLNMVNKWNSGGSTSQCFSCFINRGLDEALLLYQDHYLLVLGWLCVVSFDNP